MLDVTKTLKADLQDRLENAYRQQFGDAEPQCLELMHTAADDAIDRLATSNASYHNVEHTLYVTTTGQTILAGKASETSITPIEWAQITLALLFHDIGFVRGLCSKDDDSTYYSGTGDDRIPLERGKTDASMMPYHVDRGQCYVAETYNRFDFLDIDFIQACIERTRFPIPEDEDHSNTLDYPGLVRAADLIGQFSDPRYLHKLNALYQEFEEQGINQRIGYKNMHDMQEYYPIFYENQVLPYIAEGLRLLELSESGRNIISSLNNNLEKARQSQLFSE